MKYACIALLAALAFTAHSPAENASVAAPLNSPVITVEFSNPALSPSHWKLTLHPDGSGHFTSEVGSAHPDPSSEIHLPDVDRDVQLSARFTSRVFAIARQHSWFNQKCESHIKVAFQGWKSLSYSGPKGKGSCTFNYSRDKDIQSLGDSFQAVAQTVLEGARLELLLQHDPLGLDKEIGNLALAAQDGRAQQICIIRGILERLAQDDQVMDLVRKQARSLLAQADI